MTNQSNTHTNNIPTTLERVFIHILASTNPSMLSHDDIELLSSYGYTLDRLWDNYKQSIKRGD